MVHLTNKSDNYSIPCTRSSNILLFLTARVLFWVYRIKQLTRKCTGLSKTANYGVSITTITIVDSFWRHNDNCCYANMCSQGQAFCLLTLEFKCHLRYCSSQEVDVSLSHSAVLHYMNIIFMLISLQSNIYTSNQEPFRCWTRHQPPHVNWHNYNLWCHKWRQSPRHPILAIFCLQW